MKILIIEDDPEFAELIREDCIRAAADVHDEIQAGDVEVCRTLVEAAARLAQPNQRFDIMIVDIELNRHEIRPDILEQYLGRDVLKESKVIVYTGLQRFYDDAEFIRHMLHHGAHNFVKKGDAPPSNLVTQLTRTMDAIIKERVRGSLGRFVPQSIREVFADPKNWQKFEKGILTKKAILWCDLSGSSQFVQCQLSQGTAASQIPRFFADFYSRCAEFIFGGDGIVDKFTGDGVLAYFCAHERPEAEQCERATYAGLQITEGFRAWYQDALDRYNFVDWKGTDGRKLGLRTVIDWGEVFWGVLGSDSKAELTVLTTTVIRGRRLLDHRQGASKKYIVGDGEIFVTESVRRGNPNPQAYITAEQSKRASDVKDFSQAIAIYRATPKVKAEPNALQDKA